MGELTKDESSVENTSKADGVDRRRAARVALTATIEFIVDADVICATSVDLSDTGIRFRTDSPIPIRMRIEQDGEWIEKSADLVWARRVSDESDADSNEGSDADSDADSGPVSAPGGMEYGFEFTDAEHLPLEEF
jgi:hypothetical protein